MDNEETDAFGLPLTFAEDVSWLRTLRADYCNLVTSIVENGSLEDFVSSWDEDAHQEALYRTLTAIDHLERMFPFDPAAEPPAFDFEDLVSTAVMKERADFPDVHGYTHGPEMVYAMVIQSGDHLRVSDPSLQKELLLKKLASISATCQLVAEGLDLVADEEAD